MAVNGIFASDSGIPGGRKGDFASSLLRIMPTGSAPLLALTSGMPSAPAMDTVITWFEENHLSMRIQDSGSGFNSSVTTITVLDGSTVVAGNVYLVESTNEHVYVSAVSGNVLTVERGFAGTTATSGAASCFLQKISTTFEEGSSRPTAVANLGYPRFNYMQIFRNSWDVTGTARAVEWYYGDQTAKNKADAGIFHAEDMERAFIFGRKSITTRNSKPARTMDGLRAMITTNVQAGDSSMKYTELDSFFRSVFERNIKGKPNERIGFCGNIALSTMNLIALELAHYNINPTTKEFGLAVTKWITPYGTFSLLTHPLFVENPLWTYDLDVYHPGAIRTRWLRATNEDDYDRNGTRAGYDSDFGVITSEVSMEYAAERTGGRYTNLAGADSTQP